MDLRRIVLGAAAFSSLALVVPDTYHIYERARTDFRRYVMLRPYPCGVQFLDRHSESDMQRFMSVSYEDIDKDGDLDVLVKVPGSGWYVVQNYSEVIVEQTSNPPRPRFKMRLKGPQA
jgi:hypothetical protein